MKTYCLTLFFFISVSLQAQTINGHDTAAVKTIDGTINEVLKIVSGEKGVKRNWEAFRFLFTPNAQITVLRHEENNVNVPVTYSLEEFVRLGMRFYENDGFIEYELSKTINEYNGIAHAFQSYYAKELEIEEQGINSYQLVHDGKRWWIVSLLWTNNRNGVPLPEEYKK
ncbi:hypothetical protein [Nafulsella turpanensis]|uniref:hypothetical protein n=1 Tax=Nafulsella turpanensis TaxID=1265690 RepID=UPI00034B3C3A|nr:hypothetical protein [Nafulsella turpanensis]